jgi:addiction module HigA family antidote
MVRIPTNQPPPHPGEILVEEFLKPYGLTQVDLADRIGVPFQRVNAIVNRHRGITPDTALRFAKLFGTSPDFWLNLQQMWDLYQAMHDEEVVASDKRIEPVKA